MKSKNKVVYETALCGILCAQALALSFLEGLLPAVGWLPPGAKPGFSNIITMFTVQCVGFPQALTVTFIKSLFAFFTRGTIAGVMSFAGGMMSTLAMFILIRFFENQLGIIGVSVICALVHNTSQLAISMIITGSFNTVYYAPALGVSAVIAGIITGILLRTIMPVLEKQKKYFTYR